MIKNQSTRRLFGLISTALTASILMQWLIIPEFKLNDNVMADRATDEPTAYDSASSINYATILGGAVEYGIVADKVYQLQSHTETNFATNHFGHCGTQNNDIDYVSSTAHFIIADSYQIVEDSTGWIPQTDGEGNNIPANIVWGPCRASSIYIEAPQSVFGDSFDAVAARDANVARAGTFNGNITFNTDYNRFGHNPAVIQALNNRARSNVDRLINRISDSDGWSATLDTRARSEDYALNPNGIYCPYFTGSNGQAVTSENWMNLGKLRIDLTSDVFDGQVVYINVTNEMLKYFEQTGDVVITKLPSTNIVFNFPANLDLTNTNYGNGDGILTLNKPRLIVPGTGYDREGGDTPTNGNDPATSALVQQNLNEHVIWNVMPNANVNLEMMGGAILCPNSPRVTTSSGNSSGWIVTSGDVYMANEFHFLYQGVSDDGYGQMHFALRKAFTQNYPASDLAAIVEDNSVSYNGDEFVFNWAEYTDATFTTPVDGTATNTSLYSNSFREGNYIFPQLTFTAVEPGTTGFHCVEKGGSATFYFQISEVGAGTSTTLASGRTVSNSRGTVSIVLKVSSDANGNLTYQVQSQITTGNDTVVVSKNDNWNSSNWTPVSGHQYDLGAFFNEVAPLETGCLSITKTIDGLTTTTDQVFVFDVYNADSQGNPVGNAVRVVRIRIPAGDSTRTQLVSNLPVGNYVIQERTPSSIGDYYFDPTNTVSIPADGNVTIVATNTDSNPATYSITNSYTQTPETGVLRVTKTIGGAATASDITGEFEFYVQCGSQYLQGDGRLGTQQHNFRVSASQPFEMTVPVGTYTVTEVNPSANDTATYTFTTTGSTTSVSNVIVTSGTSATTDSTAALVNNYTNPQQSGSIKFDKTVVGYTSTSAQTFTFNVYSGTDNTGTLYRTVDVTVAANGTTGTATITGVPVGDYYIEEVASSATRTGYTLSTTEDHTASVTVQANQESTAAITNTYTQNPTPTGSIEIDKTVVGYTSTSAQTFTFNVYSGTDNTGTLYRTVDVTVAANGTTGTATITGVPVGDYYIEEVTSSATRTGYTLSTTEDHTASVTVQENQKSTAAITNTYTQNPTPTGSIEIDKTVVGYTSTSAQTFTFNVYSGTDNTGTLYRTVDVTVAANGTTGTATITGVPVGDYYIEEVTSSATRTGYTLSTTEDHTASVTVQENQKSTAAITNTYTSSSTSTATIDISKITATGTTELAGATIELTGTAGGNTITFAQSQFTEGNGAAFVSDGNSLVFTSGTTASSISGLADGSYTLTETLAPSVTGGTYTVTTPITFDIVNGAITNVDLQGGTTQSTQNTYTAATTTTNANFSLFDAFVPNPVPTGSISIDKSLGGLANGATLDAVASFEFYVTWTDTSVTPNVTYYYYPDANGDAQVTQDPAQAAILIRIAAGSNSNSAVMNGLVAGRTYSISEVSYNSTITAGGVTYDYVSNNCPATADVTAGNTTHVAVTNTYASQPQPSTCNIDIDKTTVGGVEVAGATITVTNTNGTDLSGCTVGGGAQSSSISGNVITFVSGSNGVTTIVGLPDGDYVLEETIVPTVSGGTYTVATTIGFTINSGSVVDSSVTGITDGNGYQPSTGTANAVFVLFDNFTADPTQTTPSETTPSDTTPSDTTPTETTPTETSSEDTQPAVPQYGCLVISKTISGTSLNELETITFELTDTSCGATREVPALTLANVQSGLWGDAGNGTYYYIVEGLSAGVTYTVTESLDGHTSTYSLDAVNSITTGSAMIVANGTVYVNLTDAYVTGDGTPATEPSSSDETTPTDETSETTAPEVSSVTLDGQPLSPDSYTVNPDGTITLNDAVRRSLGSGDHTIVITYVNGATRTQTVHVDGADRDVAETGETSVNAVAAVVMLSALVLIYFSKKLRDEAEAEAEN